MLNGLRARTQTLPDFSRNVAWMAWSGTISIANSVIIWMLFARWRDAAEMGRFTLVMSLYLLFFTICSLGLNPYLVAEITRRRTAHSEHSETINNDHSLGKFLFNALLLLLSWALACIALMNVIGHHISAIGEVHSAVLVMSLILPVTAITTIAESYLTAIGRAKTIAIATTAENVFRTVVPIILLIGQQGLIAICMAFAMARCVALLIYGLSLRSDFSKFEKASFILDQNQLRHLFSVTPTFAGITILASIHLQLAVILLGKFGTEEDAAIYGVASRFLIPFAILMSSYAGVLQPLAVQKALASASQLAEFLIQSSKYVLLGAAVVAMVGIMTARPILIALFGAKYAAGAPTLSLLLGSIVPFCGVMILARGLIAIRKQQIDLLGNATAVIASLLLGILLIPTYGAGGAAFAHLASMVILFSIEATYLCIHLFRPRQPQLSAERA